MDRAKFRLALRMVRAALAFALEDPPEPPPTAATDVAALRGRITALLRERGPMKGTTLAHALKTRNCGVFREVLLQLVQDGLVVRDPWPLYVAVSEPAPDVRVEAAASEMTNNL